jgi:diaminohydroxyphosphoribosylaminopyrimidine deaminase/5-amino-6-(5-phosphoribosylamino)uracil reductase
MTATDEQFENDLAWMQHALDLAMQGVGLASPNPAVGCVLVNGNNEAIGEGFHQYDLRDHAEVVALNDAGPLAKGATAYVTLEPCSHTGRTGPCADALIAAQVERVVIATLDANPIVRGNGVARLRAAGIPVDIGIRQQQAQRLNDAFAKYIRTGLPWVTLKSALSLDDRIAPAASQRTEQTPVWLTSEESREEVHRMRHAHDAILTGIGTVLADDPLLTDRSSLARRRPLLRVVLDRDLRTPLDSQLVKSAANHILIFTDTSDEQRVSMFERAGIRIARWHARSGQVPLNFVLEHLGKMQITSVMIEAGTRLNTTALGGNFVDELVQFHAPLLLGPEAIRFTDPAIELQTCLHQHTEHFGPDLCTRRIFRTYWD